MKIATLLLLLIAVTPALSAQEGGLKVDVKAVAEGKAEPGKDYTLKLRFTVPEGYHAYHKDNPGYSLPIKVEWKELAGLKLAKATWPEPKKHKDDFSEEWELSGTFDIAYDFAVPADAKGSLTVTGTHETQFCNADGCLVSEGGFSATIEVAAEEVPSVKVAAAFEGEAIAGGEATFKLTYTFTKGYHLYAKDNPGYGLAPAVEFTDKAGLELKGEKWPEATKVKIEEDWIEWEYKDTFTVTYTFIVPKDAKGDLKLAGKINIQICDEDACHDRNATFSAALKLKPAKDEGARTRPRDHGLMSIHAPPDVRARPEIADKPQATVAPRFQAPGKPGGTVKLDMIFTLPSGFHAYHRDNEAQGGIGTPPKIEFTELAGFEVVEVAWPEGQLVAYPDSPSELELPERFVLSYTLKVPADAYGPIKLKGKWSALICTEGTCYPNSGEFEGHTHVFYGDFDDAMARAKAANKPLLVDFNGRNCAPCRRMEATVFTLPEVELLLEEYVIVSLMTDIGDEKANALWDKYKPSATAGVPFYAVMDYDAKVLRGIASTLPAEKRGNEFVEFLKAPAAVEPEQPKPEPKPPTEVAMPVEKKSEPSTEWPSDILPGMYPRIEQGFDFEAKFSTDRIKPGTEVTLELRFKLKDNERGIHYHLHHPKSPSSFAIPLEIKFAGNDGLLPDGDLQFPGWTEVDEDMGDGTTDKNYYMVGEVILVQKFKVPADLKPGTYRVWGQIKGQFCDDVGCIDFVGTGKDAPNRQFGFVASIAVTPEGSDSVVTEVDTTNKGGEESPGESGLLWFLLLAFGAGIITLLTPCVLPVLPLTVGFFVSQNNKGKSSLLTAFIYCTCIVATFTLFGLITSIVLGASGAQNISTNGYVNTFLALMFLVFALSFLGLFELRVPAFMTQWFTKKQLGAQQEGHGYAKAFFSGSAFSLISFSCTGPIAGTFLAQAATGSFWVPTIAMLAFASGMALPIFIMGLFPSLLKKMPKSGGWMNAMKVVFGFIEIGLAIMYFSAAEQAFRGIIAAEWVNRYVVLAVWASVSAASALYLFGVFRMPHDHEETKQIGVIRSLIGVGFLAFAIYMVPGIFGAKYGPVLEGILPPPPADGGIQLGFSGGQKNDAHSLPWHEDFEEGLAAAKVSGRPVFVDFTGYN